MRGRASRHRSRTVTTRRRERWPRQQQCELVPAAQAVVSAAGQAGGAVVAGMVARWGVLDRLAVLVEGDPTDAITRAQIDQGRIRQGDTRGSGRRGTKRPERRESRHTAFYRVPAAPTRA